VASAEDEPVSTRETISEAIDFPIPLIVSSFPSRTRAERSGTPVTASAAFSKARTLNQVLPLQREEGGDS
jgi:hypothetical protein